MQNWLTMWIHEFLVDFVAGLFAGVLSNIDSQVSYAGTQLAQSPMAWGGGSAGSIVQSLASTVIPPIAGIILAYVMCWELIQMLTDSNVVESFELKHLFVYIAKMVIAVFLATNAWTIVMGMFDVAGWLIGNAAGHIGSEVVPTFGEIRSALEESDIPALLSLMGVLFLLNLGMPIMTIIILIIVWGRMMEILVAASAAPIPLATLMQRDLSSIGQNYLKYLAALGFQGFIIMVCLAIYTAIFSGLITAPPGGGLTAGDVGSWAWRVAAVNALLVFMLIKSGGVAKTIFNTH